MTSPGTVLELRSSWFSRAAFVVSIGVALVLLVTALRAGDAVFTPVVLLFLGAITVYNGATVASRVRAGLDGSLEVRNRFRTRRLSRDQIDRVLIGRQGGTGSVARAELLLTDGSTLQLVATEVPPLPPLKRRLEQQVAELRTWVGPTARPAGLG